MATQPVILGTCDAPLFGVPLVALNSNDLSTGGFDLLLFGIPLVAYENTANAILDIQKAYHALTSDNLILVENKTLVVQGAHHVLSSDLVYSLGPYYSWGDDSPVTDEMRNQWAAWKYANGNPVAVVGDPSWGSVFVSEPCFGPVLDLGSDDSRTFTLVKDKYDSGVGLVKVYIRGSDTIFDWDDVSPSWVEYTAPVTGSWQFVQLKMES